MSDRAPYSRVYWEVQSDEKFDGIREDMRLMGAWVTLLLVADQAWPAPAYQPPIVPKSALRALVDAGLVDILSGGRFHIRGLDAERTKRSDKASNAAAVRWQSERTPNDMPRRDETSKDKTSRADAREPIDRIVDVWLSIKYRLPTDRQRQFLYAYLMTFDVTGEERCKRLMLANPADPIEALKADLHAFRADATAKLEAKEEETKRLKASNKAPLPDVTRELLAEWGKQKSEDAA